MCIHTDIHTQTEVLSLFSLTEMAVSYIINNDDVIISFHQYVTYWKTGVTMETVTVYDMRPSSGRRKSMSQEQKLDPEVEREQDICRHVINTELMMLHGHNVDGVSTRN